MSHCCHTMLNHPENKCLGVVARCTCVRLEQLHGLCELPTSPASRQLRYARALSSALQGVYCAFFCSLCLLLAILYFCSGTSNGNGNGILVLRQLCWQLKILFHIRLGADEFDDYSAGVVVVVIACYSGCHYCCC